MREVTEGDIFACSAVIVRLIATLLKDYTDPKDSLGEHSLLKHLTKRVIERVLEAELTTHLGYAPHARNGNRAPNFRKSQGKKTVQTETAQFAVAVPRDRNGSFEPQLVPKRQRWLEGFDDPVLALYACDLSTHEIQAPPAQTTPLLMPADERLR